MPGWQSAGGGAIIKRLGDLMQGRPEYSARLKRSLSRPPDRRHPGDLCFVFPYTSSR
jgi:uncharacterized FAD-dependent dehydrogenase